jgi:CheY-like chemotaxis protein
LTNSTCQAASALLHGIQTLTLKAGWPCCTWSAPSLHDGKARMSATILLIDDNAVQAATRQTILKRAGYFVIAVLSPQRALEQLRNNDFPEPIDLVLTDHIMPGMTGSEFVARLREFQPNLPVLVISGMADAEEEYETLGVEFRLKPLLPDNLLASVHRLISPGTPQASPA